MEVKDEFSKTLSIADDAVVEKALWQAVRHALLMHKRAGNPIASGKDGKVVIIPPEEIPVEDPLEK